MNMKRKGKANTIENKAHLYTYRSQCQRCINTPYMCTRYPIYLLYVFAIHVFDFPIASNNENNFGTNKCLLSLIKM